jgi:hypothetical protein
MHILSVVQAGGEVVITIDAFDPEGDEILPAQITTLPGNVGEVYHPSQIFSTHGLDPTRGEKIDQPGTFLRAADKQQLVYARPSVDSLPKNGGMWGQMAFSVSDSSSESGSSEGLVYFVPPGIFCFYIFLFRETSRLTYPCRWRTRWKRFFGGLRRMAGVPGRSITM